MKTPETVIRFWAYQRARGAAPKKVYVLRAGHDHQQPIGYCLGWSIWLTSIDRQAERISNQGPTYIEVITP